MKRILTAFLAGLSASLLLFALTASAAALTSDEVTVRGVIRAVTDEDEEITGTYIETDDQDYLVADTPTGQELRKHIGKYVEAKGEVRPAANEDEDPTLVVKSYKLIESTDGSAN